ncbi:4Fe-4S ferredoxin-type, iron-sulphur binding domain protein [Acididesulfobacillus acetoxydans]|uniref:4Fe-4S ferredoxin-type, iron-sulphur binding domain protein n=1 Tax=Acididesulfobacillus acetoxydans TaxID=1561005 RepID=A0A8S0W772_9FIRM|nr:4Fe-4S dicluster domain-containing protein [Acididesulfobacillus acetoxydans]CAA7600429.1 4Fe-4S ferredoxin-type, iron-sulphur binding domain protein [Acididesulfobacillus acetoxydans]CEJ06563.1 Tetrathionate reductase subunit B [Acididesulfobacillus acetoxydans]
MTVRMGFVIITSRCIDCDACMVACRAENEVPIGFTRNWVRDSGAVGKFPIVKQMFEPGNCMHCEKPSCLSVCPTGATYKRADGIVLVDDTKCIGCKYCIEACPYDARFLNPVTGKADKCTFCLQRLEQGLKPACVQTCLGKARHSGDLNDPESVVSKLLNRYPARQLSPDAGTRPNIYYIDVPVAEIPSGT